jgi:hypothetical protein
VFPEEIIREVKKQWLQESLADTGSFSPRGLAQMKGLTLYMYALIIR